MSRKIMGVTVGTPTSPSKMASEITPAEIGAAPAGFGLGNIYGKNFKDNDANNALEIGWHVSNDPAKAKNLPTNSNVHYGAIRVDRRYASVSQELSYNGYIVRRSTQDMGATWTEWEWVNPPMELGVEYRTTERYKGKPVYVFAMSLGAMPNKSEKDVYYPIAILAANVVSFEVMITSVSNGARALPSYASDGTLFGYPHLLNNAIRINTFRDLSAWNGHAIIKYTKD